MPPKSSSGPNGGRVRCWHGLRNIQAGGQAKTQRHAVATLSEIGIQKQSSRWQSIAALRKKDFEGYIQENKQG